MSRPKSRCTSCNKELGSNKPGYKHKLCKSCCKKGIKFSDDVKENMSKARKGIKFSDSHKSNLSKHLSKINGKGEKSPSWKGDKVGYHGLHKWIQSELGKPKYCADCGTTTAKRFEWANISGLYKRETKDFKRLCTSCHIAFDKAKRTTRNN